MSGTIVRLRRSFFDSGGNLVPCRSIEFVAIERRKRPLRMSATVATGLCSRREASTKRRIIPGATRFRQERQRTRLGCLAMEWEDHPL